MRFKKFYVKPKIHSNLYKLYQLATNMWSYWDKEAERLFSRIDSLLYMQTRHNLKLFLEKLPTEVLDQLASDRGFLTELDKVWNRFQEYIKFEGTYIDDDNNEVPFQRDKLVAYFSMEFGLHESLPVYSGGLGILAGDFLKAASDIDIPLVGVGLLYRYGYFTQRININGYQEEKYLENDWFSKPIEILKDEKGEEIKVQVEFAGKKAIARAWKIMVGNVPLYLLDTNIPDNPPEIQRITNMLYDPDRDIRLQQEILLGIGGVRLMEKLGIDPSVCHINEGHSAFLILERLRRLIQKGYSLEEARLIIRNSTVFTTHTPVIEGNEHYSVEMIKKYLTDMVENLGFKLEDFLKLGTVNSNPDIFWLPAFAIRSAAFVNGVSRIHCDVSRKMWISLFPEHHITEIPIDHVTNGVHIATWLSMEMVYLFDRYLGPDYIHAAEKQGVWEKVFSIPDEELWSAHRRRKEQLISFIRNRLVKQLREKGASAAKIRKAKKVLNPSYMTIGFARRFAPYKRADLILTDPDRFAEILRNPEKPVQIIFSGKAHPADQMGKELIKKIIDFAKEYDLEDRVVFVEDYDMDVAKHLVQGVDVWLNNPLKPLEASGTSGMKAGVNGVLNLSVLDGWWPECYDGENGWAITAGEEYDDPEMKKIVESAQIYDLLENDITELFYLRDENDLPEEWVEKMKRSIYCVGKNFNMHRVLREYLYKFYLPGMRRVDKLVDNEGAILKQLLDYKEEIDKIWSRVYVRDFFIKGNNEALMVGEEVEVEAYLYIDDADRELLEVQFFHCTDDDCNETSIVPLQFREKYNDGVAKYTGKITVRKPGLQAGSVRIVPAWDLFNDSFPGYIKWW